MRRGHLRAKLAAFKRGPRFDDAGVVMGAILVNVLLEVLREPEDARWIFYVGVIAALVAVLLSPAKSFTERAIDRFLYGERS